MADMKFSCTQCGQHISCDEAWSGHQIPCPACQTNLIVPRLQAPAAPAPPPSPLAPQPPAPGRSKLSAGATQATRPTPSSALPRRPVPRPPKADHPVLRFAIIIALAAVIGGLGYAYVPGWVRQFIPTSGAPASGNTSSGGGSGPLGEVNGAMDVSDTLDGSSPSRPRPAAAQPKPSPVAAQQPVAAKPPPTIAPPAPTATNSAAKPARRRPR